MKYVSAFTRLSTNIKFIVKYQINTYLYIWTNIFIYYNIIITWWWRCYFIVCFSLFTMLVASSLYSCMVVAPIPSPHDLGQWFLIVSITETYESLSRIHVHRRYHRCIYICMYVYVFTYALIYVCWIDAYMCT